MYTLVLGITKVLFLSPQQVFSKVVLGYVTGVGPKGKASVEMELVGTAV